MCVCVCVCVCPLWEDFNQGLQPFPKYPFSFGLFEENEWIQDQESFWRNLSVFEDYDFFIQYKARPARRTLALAERAQRRVLGAR